MKRVLFYGFALSAMLIVSGCGDDDNPVKSAEPGSITISGKIDGWSGGEDKTLYASDQNFNWNYFELGHSVGSGKISADGSFNISVSAPHKLMMDSLVNRFPKKAFTSGVTLSSPGAKYCELELYIGTKDSLIGNIYLYGKTPGYISKYNGDYFTDYIYTDTAVVIAGTYNYTLFGSDNTCYFDINFKQGWNRYTHYYQSLYIEKYMSEEMGETKYVCNNWTTKFPIVD